MLIEKDTMYCTDTNDCWLVEIIDKKNVEAVLLDFSAAFDIIDHNRLLKKRALWLFNFCHIVDSELSFMEASLMSNM